MRNRGEKYWDYYYNYDDEQLDHFIKLSSAQRLSFIEEYIEFLEKAMPPEIMEIFLKFRRGELPSPSEKKQKKKKKLGN